MPDFLLPVAPPIGRNTSSASLIAACPSRKYQRCFVKQLQARYPVTQYRLPPLPRRCAAMKGDNALHDAACTLPPAEHVLSYFNGPKLVPRKPLRSPPVPYGNAMRRCNSPVAGGEGTSLLLGVPSSPSATGQKRRAAIRASWMRDERVGRSVVVCFLLSARTPAQQLAAMQTEQEAHGDMLFVDAPETPWLIRENTKYSGFLRKGRGMPTFKQYAFFQFAAARYPNVPFVGKIDDDTAPNLRVLVPFLERLAAVEDQPWMFVGAINWASFVPQSYEFGVRGDRCGFGWSLHNALSNFGATFGQRGAPGFIEACDARGGVLPFPYGTGAGYLFSAALLRWVATSAEVTGWVADAAGPSRETLQWQKFEDTSTGYFVSYAPRTVQYVDIGPLVHDIDCHIEGERKRRGGGTYRPPTNATILVHNLKGPTAFAYAWAHMQTETLPYNNEECMDAVRRGGHRPAARRPSRRPKARAG